MSTYVYHQLIIGYISFVKQLGAKLFMLWPSAPRWVRSVSALYERNVYMLPGVPAPGPTIGRVSPKAHFGECIYSIAEAWPVRGQADIGAVMQHGILALHFCAMQMKQDNVAQTQFRVTHFACRFTCNSFCTQGDYILYCHPSGKGGLDPQLLLEWW